MADHFAQLRILLRVSDVMENPTDDCCRRQNLKIVSWNINGIRTVKNLKSLLDSFDADIICLQETKVSRDMVDEPTALVDGYNAYFSFSRVRSGYSGVATYCREQSTPTNAEEGLSGLLKLSHQSDVGYYGDIENEFSPQELKRLDAEGRAIITQHNIKKINGVEAVLTIFNVYCPRADPERIDRLEYKLRFYQLLEMRVSAVRRSGAHVVVVGDINTSHRPIDRCENVAQDEFESNQGRQWLNSFIAEITTLNTDVTNNDNNFKMVDSFRYFHPNQSNEFTCWNTMINARATNYGSRIDYVLVDPAIIQEMIDSMILRDVMGSDHCPVVGLFNVKIFKAGKCPFACIKNFPEFVGVQQKLSSFLVKKSNLSKPPEDMTERVVKKPCTENDLDQIRRNDTQESSKSTNKKVQRDISSFFTKQTCVSSRTLCASVIENQVNGPSFENSGNSSDTQSETVCLAPTLENLEKSSDTVLAWRNMLSGPRPPPLCKGHKEPCVERTVKKKGPNFNKKFFCCARGEGSKSDLNARCDHFEWLIKK